MKNFKTILLSMIIFLVSASGCAIESNNGNGSRLAKNVTSEKQLKELLNRNLELKRSDGWGWFGGGANTDTAISENASAPSKDVSNTNVQVDGIDEGDTVKVDSDYIYKIQTNGLIILKVNNDGTLTAESSVKIENYNPIELYVDNDTLIMVGGTYSTMKNDGWFVDKVGAYLDYFGYHTDVDIRVYDIADRSNIIEKQHYAIEGSYVTSRRIDDSFYVLTSKYYYQRYYKKDAGKESESTSLLPQISVNGSDKEPISLDDVYYYENNIGRVFFTIMKIDISNEEEMKLKSYLCNYTGTIYVSENYIYNALMSYTFTSNPLLNIYDYKSYTDIQRYSLETLENDIAFKVDGYVKDRYSLDEYNSYFRVASTDSNSKSTTSGVYVFNSEGKLVGKVDGLAPGEQIYSARFDKEMAYIVTYRQVDPLFVIDLSDVTNPIVKSELKKDGVSLYLHNFKNSPLMFGVGYNTNEGRTIGMEVSLYDISDNENTIMLDYFRTTDVSFYAEVLHNPKALLFMESKGLFGFAAEEYRYNIVGNYYRYEARQGYYIFKVVDNKLEVIFLSNIKSITEEDAYDYDKYIDRYKNYITRSVIIGDYLYTISDQIIGIYNVDTMEYLTKFELN